MKNIIEKAEELGFKACILDTSQLCFDFSFRDFCEQNLCGNYGANCLCPPLCSEPMEMKERVLEHKTALVLMSENHISSLLSKDEIKRAQIKHNETMQKLLENLEEIKREVALCSPDDIKLPPLVSAHCLSAYCINVKDMAEKCGMNYDFKDGRLCLFGFITLD